MKTLRAMSVGLGLLFTAAGSLGAAPARAAEITCEVDLIKIERRMVAGAFRLFAVALGNGPFKTSIAGANDKMINGAPFGGIQLNEVTRARRAFTSRAFADGSLIFNASTGTWTGMTIWLTDAAGNTFSAASESNANGVVAVRAAGDGGVANRRLNITIPNLGPFDLATQPNIVWMRMPGGAFDGALAGNPPRADQPEGQAEGCISAPDDYLTYQDFLDLSANYDYIPLLDYLVICPFAPTSVEQSSWGRVKALYR